MKLYYAPGACSLAPHIAAREAGVPLELAQVSFPKKNVEGEGSFYDINPKGAVPALRLDDGSVLTENAVLLQYIAEQAPQSDLLPPAGSSERWRLLELVNFIATEVHKGFGPLWNPAVTPEVREATVQTLGKRFDFLQTQLGDKPYLTGERFTIADAYAFAILSWTRVHKIDLGPWAGLQAYLQRVAARPAVQEALKAEGLA
ncbi:MAG TPA: glutathione transferase GstA [Caulobacteraceae bacterium]|jgi:glutathione S-transferase